MKIMIASLIVCLAGIPAFAGTTETPGRYQLFVGKMDTYQLKDPENLFKLSDGTVNTIFRIDTYTGKTWFLQRTSKKIENALLPYQNWVLIEE